MRAAVAALLWAMASPALAEPVPEAGPLAVTRPADPANGRRIVADRRRGMCLLCHAGPFPEERFMGTLAPPLQGAGSRWSEAQLRARLIDSRAINPASLMPAYHATDFNRVAPAFRGRPILTAEEIEDVVAYLVTLRD